MEQALKILIVDDEPDICYFLSRSLIKRGFRTAIAHTVKEAEEEIKAGEPFILFLDNHLPDGKGIDLLNTVSLRFPNVKSVMITAHDSPQDRASAYASGARFFLPKPFTITEINRVVDLLQES